MPAPEAAPIVRVNDFTAKVVANARAMRGRNLK
jgi:hypothetical protein